MSNIRISEEHLQEERSRLATRTLRKGSLFVLLLGPSATGKSTIISEMNKLTDYFSYEYVKPVITRGNRDGETDKISVDDATFDHMATRGEFIVVNALYTVRYGTPLKGITSPLSRGNVPILDYPLDTVGGLRRPEYDLFSVYVYPPSLKSWRERMESTGRNVNGRLEQGMQELTNLALNGYIHPDIDLSVVNHDNAQQETAQLVHQAVENLRIGN